jgi:GTP cyclohydrolase I
MKMGVKGVLIIVEGEHLCMKMRGVRNGSLIMTVAYRGILEQKELREHILSLIHTPKTELLSI